MHMFRHYYVSIHTHRVLLSNTFERQLKGAASLDCSEIRSAPVTAKGDEVRIAGFLKAFQSPGHRENVVSCPEFSL